MRVKKRSYIVVDHFRTKERPGTNISPIDVSLYALYTYIYVVKSEWVCDVRAMLKRYERRPLAGGETKKHRRS